MCQNSLVVSILQKDHPEVLVKINEKLEELDSNKLEFTEINIMHAFFDFATATKSDIADFDWLGNINFRRDLVAFMLLYFAPERIYGYTEKIMIRGLISELSLITHVSRQVLSNDINTVCNYFKIYKGFKEKCLDVFSKKTYK